MKHVVTHATTSFHSDDVFSVATLDLFFDGDISVTRTLDPEIINDADVVVDIGFEYDPERHRYDHHQKGGAGERDGIQYASFGLVWKHFGMELCGGDKDVWNVIEKQIAQPIDANDNGQEVYKPVYDDIGPCTVQAIVGSYKPHWKSDKSTDDAFMEAVAFAKDFLKRSIENARAYVDGVRESRAYYDKAEDKRVIVFDEASTVSDAERIAALVEYPEPIYIVRPDPDRGGWRVKGVPKTGATFETRHPLPQSWGGKKDQDVADASGVPDALFCHRALFTCSARSKEGALQMAYTALETNE